MISCQQELKQFAIQHGVIQQLFATMEAFKYSSFDSFLIPF